jgi:hypothetical protein
MGPISYHSSDAEVSVAVRSLLEEHGVLDNFSLAPVSYGKRAKATAWFETETDARLAGELDKRSIPVLNGGKLTVTLIASAKIKMPTSIYAVSQSKIRDAKVIWATQHLVFHA